MSIQCFNSFNEIVSVVSDFLLETRIFLRTHWTDSKKHAPVPKCLVLSGNESSTLSIFRALVNIFAKCMPEATWIEDEHYKQRGVKISMVRADNEESRKSGN